MDEGKVRLHANDYPRAIEAIGKANDLMHVPTTGLALAKAHLAAGHLIEARDAAIAAEKLPREDREPKVFDAARKQAAELARELKPRIPTVRLRIEGTATKIVVDGTEVPPSIAGEPIAMNPGKHTIVATGDAGDARAEPELAEREAKDVALVLGHEAEPPSRPRPVPKATTPLDDRQHGTRTPLAKGLVYGGLGAGILGLGAGAVTGVMTLSRASKVDPQCANDVCAPSARSDLDRAQTLGTLSTVAFVVGGVGIAAGVVGLLLPKQSGVALGAGGITGTF